MRSRRWGLIAVVALVTAAALLGITLMWQRGPQATISSTPTGTGATVATSSPSPAATPTAPRLITYSVQAGDTLSAIAQEHDVSLEALTTANNLADPDVLQIGQVLIIPRDDGTAPPSPTLAVTPDASGDEEPLASPPTLTPSGPPLVEIEQATGVGDLEAETILLTNQSGRANLEAWTLSNPTGDQFVFPALTLFSDGAVRVHSAAGDDTPRDLYWGRTESAWQEGELVTLRDADGNVVDTYIVPE